MISLNLAENSPAGGKLTGRADRRHQRCRFVGQPSSVDDRRSHPRYIKTCHRAQQFSLCTAVIAEAPKDSLGDLEACESDHPMVALLRRRCRSRLLPIILLVVKGSSAQLTLTRNSAWINTTVDHRQSQANFENPSFRQKRQLQCPSLRKVR